MTDEQMPRAWEAQALAKGLGGVVAGHRQEDGSWMCECGEVRETSTDLYLHRLREAPHIEEEP